MIDSVIHIVLLIFLACTALAIVSMKDLFAVVMLAGIYGLLSASFFVAMDAVDVAFTEAAVGAGVSTLLLLSTLTLTGRYERGIRHKPGLALLAVTVTGVLLVYGTMDMPGFGSEYAPVHQHVAPRYISESGDEIGIPNMVTSVLASYRAYDTFGELVVIFTAGMGVLSLLMAPVSIPGNMRAETALLNRHKVLRVAAKMLIPLILLFALYVQFHGEYGPGGGFQAGVIFAAAVILHLMLFGLKTTTRAIKPLLISTLSALGVIAFALLGVAGLPFDNNFLEYTYLSSDPLRSQHYGILFIELCVGVTVASIMMIIFFSFTSYIVNNESS